MNGGEPQLKPGHIAILRETIPPGWRKSGLYLFDQTLCPLRHAPVELTADRGDLMEGIRQSLLLDSTDRGSRQSLFVATSMFERLIWLVRQVLALGELEPQA